MKCDTTSCMEVLRTVTRISTAQSDADEIPILWETKIFILVQSY